MDRLLVLAAMLIAVVVVSIVARVAIRRRHAITRIDPADLGSATAGVATVIFTSPYCHGCRQWIEALGERGAAPLEIDIRSRPEAAAKYRINATPRVAVARLSDGTVLREFDHYTPRAHDLDAIERLLAAG